MSFCPIKLRKPRTSNQCNDWSNWRTETIWNLQQVNITSHSRRLVNLFANKETCKFMSNNKHNWRKWEYHRGKNKNVEKFFLFCLWIYNSLSAIFFGILPRSHKWSLEKKRKCCRTLFNGNIYRCFPSFLQHFLIYSRPEIVKLLFIFPPYGNSVSACILLNPFFVIFAKQKC